MFVFVCFSQADGVVIVLFVSSLFTLTPSHLVSFRSVIVFDFACFQAHCVRSLS